MSDSTQAAAGQDNTAPQAQGDSQAQAAQTVLFGSDTGQPAAAAKPDADTEKQGTEGDKKPEDKQPDADKSEADKADDKKEGDESKDDKKPEGAPEKYELKAPEGFEKLDEQLVEAFEPIAREFNLTNEQAQKLTETMMPKVVERMTEQSREAWSNTIESWVGEVKGDKELGGDSMPANLDAANRAVAKFGSPELKALLDYPSAENPKGLGLGNHPELVRVFSRIGKAMAEDGMVNGNSAGDGKKSQAEVLFGSSPQ